MKTTGRMLLQAPGGWTRRRFLRSLLLGMLAKASSACRYPGDGQGPGQPAAPAWLSSVITAPESAARLGRSYLDLHPDESNMNRLLADIEAAVSGDRGALTPNPNADRIAAVLQRVVGAEYTRNQVVAVSGWVLSRTEARLYALVSLNTETSAKTAH
jgi:hypothetical protein